MLSASFVEYPVISFRSTSSSRSQTSEVDILCSDTIVAITPDLQSYSSGYPSQQCARLVSPRSCTWMFERTKRNCAPCRVSTHIPHHRKPTSGQTGRRNKTGTTHPSLRPNSPGLPGTQESSTTSHSSSSELTTKNVHGFGLLLGCLHVGQQKGVNIKLSCRASFTFARFST